MWRTCYLECLSQYKYATEIFFGRGGRGPGFYSRCVLMKDRDEEQVAKGLFIC